MKILIPVLAAVTAYLISGINPAIILSRAVYGKDIRECGSGNPGFTNFKRSFGSRLAWLVMALDLLKSALPSLVFAFVFENLWGLWQTGVAFTCLFSMLGHAFPVWYGFKGGKGFLVCLSATWVLHPLAGLTATCVMVVLLLTTKYMSLATMLGLISAVALMPFLKLESIHPLWLFGVCVLFMIIRHKENVKRLFKGTESKFYLFGKKKQSELDTDEKK